MSTTRPTLGVVIPNFNYSRYLPKALESVLAQDPMFDEIVVVDDGSTDNSREILARYDKRVKVINIPNGGQLGACRTGIAAIKSEYIYSLDADDYAAPGLVSRLHEVLVRRPVKVQFQLFGVDGDGTSLGSVFPTYPREYDAAAMREDNTAIGFYICPPTSGNVFSREALSRINFSSFDPRGVIDGSTVLAFPYLGEIISLNEPLAFYRVHNASMSSGSRPTVVLLQRELQRFHVTWSEVALALGLQVSELTDRAPLYIRERYLMIACLNNQLIIGSLVWSFIWKLWRTHISLKQKLLVSIWATILLVPSGRLKTKLVQMKRSSINRPETLQAVLRIAMRMRQAGIAS